MPYKSRAQQAAVAIAKKKAAAKKKTGMSKGGDTINAAGNYTKPGMRRKLVQQVKAGSKVASLDNGLREKPRWLLNNTKQKVEAIHHNESTTEKLKEVD